MRPNQSAVRDPDRMNPPSTDHGTPQIATAHVIYTFGATRILLASGKW